MFNINRIIGILKLDVHTFEEIEADKNATVEAAIIVTIVALVGSIGAAISSGQFLITYVTSFIWAIVGWVIWSAITLLVGTKLFNGQADLGEMLRVLGYAQIPNILRVLGFIPCIGPLITLVAAIWSLVAAFIAIRQGLDIDNTKALLTVFIGWVVWIVGSLLITAIFGGVALGLGAITGSLGG